MLIDKNPLTYIKKTAKLDVTGRRWESELATILIAPNIVLIKQMWTMISQETPPNLKAK